MIRIYTDGAYSSTRDQGGWAFVVTFKNAVVLKHFGWDLHTTNNRMEILGVLEALLWLQENLITTATIVTDSMYVIGTITKGWKRNVNNDLWDEIDIALKGLNITLEHVKGHSGVEGNELCDALAGHGSHIELN